jgi:hypothetical protein
VDGGEGIRDQRLANPLELFDALYPERDNRVIKINQEPAPPIWRTVEEGVPVLPVNLGTPLMV